MLLEMRWRGRLGVLGALALVAPATATAWPTTSTGQSPPVHLRLPSHTLRAGQSVQVKIVKPASRDLLISSCFLLQLRQADGWKTITRTHEIKVPCSLTNSSVILNPPDDYWSLILYDDLQPGTYQITMAYKVLPNNWRTASIKHNYRLMRDELRVLRFRPAPAPHLSERQIRRIEMSAIAGGGDPHPSLIQHAEGTRFEANLIASPDLIFDWSWAYLIAIHGHFKWSSTGVFGSYSRRESSPAGSHTIHNSVITVILNAKTGQTEDFGTSDHYPDLAKLGPVTTDYGH